ncbi:MAG: hypothetical protein QME59_03235 [Candidatus Hydrothermarchaeota archaeon]|nr:hypothetical protein [Candidatus Hydrothermarchaeota archaeon]
MILVVFPYALKQNELNKALAAARDGATYGASLRGMGFRGENVKEIPQGVVKIEEIKLVEMSDKLTEEEKTRVGAWYQIRFQVSIPDYMKDKATCSGSSIGMTIRKRSISYINYAFYGDWTPEDELKVYTDRFKFTTACDFV